MAGRPTIFDQEIFDLVCEELMLGKTLKQICREQRAINPKFPTDASIRLWAGKDEPKGIFSQYAHARDIGLDAMAEELFSIADDGENDYMTVKMGGRDVEVEHKEFTSRSKLRIDTRKWYLSKIAPKRYSDRLEIAGDKDAPLLVQIIDDIK